MRLIRVMCSGRVDLSFIFRAFAKGQDGVFVGGCKLGECNYTTHGNFDAFANVSMGKRILDRIGLNPKRLRIEFMSGADGNLLAEKTDAFTREIKELGPLGSSEDLNEKTARFRLEAVRQLVPFLKLAERERLRVPEKTEQAYESFFSSPDLDLLFDRLFSDRLAISQIMLLLSRSPMSTEDIAQSLDLNPSEVSRHMLTSSRHGMVHYDTKTKCYTRTMG